MATEREDCIDRIAAATGRPRKFVEDELERLLDRAEVEAVGGESPWEALGRAAQERLEEEAARSAFNKRSMIENRLKFSRLARYVDNAPSASAGIEAKLVGVNTTKAGWANRDSVAAKGNMLYDRYGAGFVRALQRAKLWDAWDSGLHTAQIERELFELNQRGDRGNPGVTNDPVALEIAKAIQSIQQASVENFNKAGGWIGEYSGYVQKTRHDPEKIREAGRDKWVGDIMADPDFDMRRSFGTTDRQKVVDILNKMWVGMKNGDHLDHGRDLEQQLFPNMAAQESAHRELHWRGFGGQQRYLAKYGRWTFNEAVMRSFESMAKRTALVSELGTKPQETFEQLLEYQYGRTKETDQYQELEKNEDYLRAAYMQLDGSANKPVNTAWSRTARFVMAIKRMSLLVRVPFTHLAGLPVTMGSELGYWGASFGERYGSIMRGFLKPGEGSEKAQVADTVNAGVWARLGAVASAYDTVDVSGRMARMQDRFFRMTGIATVMDNHRLEANTAMMYHMGKFKGKEWSEVGRYEQRIMGMFGINEAEWKALQAGDKWRIGENDYLTPKIAESIPDDAMTEYVRSKQPISQRAQPLKPSALDDARQELVDKLATAFSDRGRFAIFGDDPRTRAMLFGTGSLSKAGTWQNAAWRMILQFKQWPAQMFVNSWGREFYGRAGDPWKDRAATFVIDLAIMATMFGAFSEALREITGGQNPFTRMQHSPLHYLTRGWLKSGAGTIAGDFVFGEFDRHGHSAAANILGPTIGQFDQWMDMLHGGGAENRHPWQTRAADAIKIAKSWMPFVDMWWTMHAFDYLFTYRLQEWLNPGYLARMEKRMKEKQGVEFMVSPQVNPWKGFAR